MEFVDGSCVLTDVLVSDCPVCVARTLGSLCGPRLLQYLNTSQSLMNLSSQSPCETGQCRSPWFTEGELRHREAKGKGHPHAVERDPGLVVASLQPQPGTCAGGEGLNSEPSIGQLEEMEPALRDVEASHPRCNERLHPLLACNGI